MVDIPDAAFRASMDDLLSSNLQTYLGLVEFLPLISDCVVEPEPEPEPEPVVFVVQVVILMSSLILFTLYIFIFAIL